MRFVLYVVDTVTALHAAIASIVAANYAAVNVLFVDVGLGYLRKIWRTMTRRHDSMMQVGGLGGLREMSAARRPDIVDSRRKKKTIIVPLAR